MNCLFSDRDINDISCPGIFVKILGTAPNKNLACMNKCMSAEFVTQEICYE